MMVIRPIRAEDYPELYDIAVESGHGFTSLPVNDELLQRKISRSEASFAKKVDKPGDEGYLFVLEDPETGAVVGTSAIEAAVGLEDAFYHYHLGKVVHTSRALGVYNPVDILTLCMITPEFPSFALCFYANRVARKTMAVCCQNSVFCLSLNSAHVLPTESLLKCVVCRMKTAIRHSGNGCRIVSFRWISPQQII